MNHRRHGTVPALALWVLIVVGNMAMIVANAGLAVVIAVLGVVFAGLAALGYVVLRRGHGADAPARVRAPLAMPVRRQP
jgi:hypothetical protein